MSSLQAPLLLAFGVGFSYQLGLEEPPESSKRGQRQAGEKGEETAAVVGTAATAAGAGGDRRRRAGGSPNGGRGSSGKAGKAGTDGKEPRICSSIQSKPKAIAIDRFVKKGDSPAFAAAGANHSILRTTDGKLFRWGVEDGDIYRFPTGVCTQIPLPCVEVCCGRKHTMALMKGGFVMTWGTGYFGQLGHGDNASYRHPRLLRRLDPHRLGERVVQVACGGYHSAVATDAGRLFAWGFNRYGQCGNGSKDNTVPEPSLVDLSGVPHESAGGVPKVLCGRHHSALVTSKGGLYSWGACSFGKLGLQDPEKTVCAPREVSYFADKPLLQAAAGDFHMVALSRKREVFSWGYGAEGQGGHGSLLHMRTPRRVNSLQEVPVAQVVCGPWWSMAVTVDGYVYAWGSADGGWTGLGRPSGLSVVDPGPSNDRAVETQSFDSTHNVHVPALVYSLAPYKVLQVGCGGGHTLVVAEPRTPPPSPELDRSLRVVASGAPDKVVRGSSGGGGGGGTGGGTGTGTGTGATVSSSRPDSSTSSSSSSPPESKARNSTRSTRTASLSSVSPPAPSAASEARSATLPSASKPRQRTQAARASKAAAAAAVAAAAAEAATEAEVEATGGARRSRAAAAAAAAAGRDPTVSVSVSVHSRDSEGVDGSTAGAAAAAAAATEGRKTMSSSSATTTSRQEPRPQEQQQQQQRRRQRLRSGSTGSAEAAAAAAGKPASASRPASASSSSRLVRAGSAPGAGAKDAGGRSRSTAAAAAAAENADPSSPERFAHEALLPKRHSGRLRTVPASSSFGGFDVAARSTQGSRDVGAKSTLNGGGGGGGGVRGEDRRRSGSAGSGRSRASPRGDAVRAVLPAASTVSSSRRRAEPPFSDGRRDVRPAPAAAPSPAVEHGFPAPRPPPPATARAGDETSAYVEPEGGTAGGKAAPPTPDASEGSTVPGSGSSSSSNSSGTSSGNRSVQGRDGDGDGDRRSVREVDVRRGRVGETGAEATGGATVGVVTDERSLGAGATTAGQASRAGGDDAGGIGGGGEQRGVRGGRGDRPASSREDVAKVFSYCRHGRLEEVRKVLSEGFDVCGLRDENGNTLLHCAAQNGLRGMCKSLLREGKGEPLNLRNNRGNTALHYAFAFGFQQLGKYLAASGADDTLLNDQGLTCYEGLDRHDVESL